jgi:prepilin-type N-terminal cleavage/methylation domain-containing protein
MTSLIEITTARSPAFKRRGRESGFSMSEMVIVISILGVLAGVALISMTGAYGAAEDTLAANRLETLNRALYQFSQQNYELVFNPRAESATDEMFVLRTLEYRNPDTNKAKIGSPYVTPCYNPTTSSVPEDFRIRWNGRMFELLRPGQSGTGLKVTFDGSDLTEAFSFPPNFQMAGR